jgi:hypothetical protein
LLYVNTLQNDICFDYQAFKGVNNLQVYLHVLQKITEVPYKNLMYLVIRGIAAGEFAFVELSVCSEVLLINDVAENMYIFLFLHSE